MAGRSTDLRVTISGNAERFERAMQRASRATSNLERELSRGNRQAQQFDQQLRLRQAATLERVGRGMLIFGGAVVAGLGLATKAAINWESAWAGVRKTVEGTPEQLAAVEAGLRDLATTLPVSHREIAAVAEAAGQLGVATDDVVGFTRVMIDLGETTNLTADEAATSIAQLMNVMQTAPADVGRLGAALVELGNNGASTERDIIQMAQRIAGAGAIVGLSEADVLGLANALASVGIEAEAGGTAISTAMVKMAGAVAEGGDAVEGFAEVAGMSAAEFTRAFEEDPARAIQAFVTGLARIDSAGGNVFATLDDLGLGSIRTRDALLRLAGAGNVLGQSLSDGARAWDQNTALVEEAAKRYDTAEAKIRIAWNTLVDFGIDIGNVILPLVSGLADAAADLGRWFGDLSGPSKTVATVLGGLVGVLTLLGGGFLMLAPKLAAARAELEVLRTISPGVATGLTKLGKAAGVATVLLTVAGAIIAIQQATKDAAPGIGETTKQLLDLADGVEGKLIEDLKNLQAELVHQRERLQEAKSSWVEYKDSFAGTELKDLVAGNEEFADVIERVDTTLADLVAGGNAEKAQEIIAALAESLGVERSEIEELLLVLPQYRDAVAQADADQRLATEGAQGLAAGLESAAATTEAATEALQAYVEELQKATDPVFAVLSALESVETAQAAYNDAVEEHGENSAETRAAAIDLAEAVAGVEAAVLDGDLSWQDFDATLSRWVAQGVITEGQAEAIRDSTDEAREAAEDYEGEYPAQLKLARDKAAEREAQRKLDAIAKARKARLIANLTGQAGTESALRNLARPRSATIHVGYAVTGSGLPRGVTGHTGGMVTSYGIQRMHDGGPVRRFHNGSDTLRGDEVPAILQTGERVLSRVQTRAFDQLIRSSPYIAGGPGLPRMHDGGMVQASAAPVNVAVRFEGNGALYEQIAKGMRTGQLRMTANGAQVKVG